MIEVISVEELAIVGDSDWFPKAVWVEDDGVYVFVSGRLLDVEAACVINLLPFIVGTSLSDFEEQDILGSAVWHIPGHIFGQ